MSKDFKALVVKEDVGLLPEGFITRFLGPNEEPSVYECSETSPWEVKTFVKDPRDKRKKVKDKLGRDRKDLSDVYVIKSGGLKKKKHGDVWKKFKHREGHKPPPHLKHESLVWDYGSGRTYSSPQSALDALIAFQGLALFTETHYIRGWGGTYIDAEQVLHVHDLYPDQGNGHELIIDVEPGESVVWQAGDYGSVGPISNAYAGVEHYYLRGLTIEVTEQEAAAVAASALKAANDTWFYDGLWLYVEDCILKHTGPDPGDGVAALVRPCLYPRLTRCLITGFAGVGPSYTGLETATCFLTLNSTVAHVVNNAFDIETGNGEFVIISTENCAIKCEEDLLNVIPGLGNVVFNRLNCSFEAGGTILSIPGIPLWLLFSMCADYDLYKYGTSFGIDKNGTFDLSTVQSYLNRETHSLDDVEPLIDWDAIEAGLEADAIPVDDESPLFQNGGTLAAFGYNDLEISRGLIDIGAFQKIQEIPLTCEGVYCTEQNVIDESGVTPEDLDRPDEGALNSLLCAWILETTEVIEEYCGITFDPVPAGITRACTMMAANVVNISRQRRKTNVLEAGQQDTFRVRVVKSDILTDEVTEILDLYKVGKDVGDGSDDGTLLAMDVLTEDDY